MPPNIKNEYQGTVEDPRTEDQKAEDYKYENLARGDVPLNWIEYGEKNLKSFPIQNQDSSSSCVAQGTSKILAMHEVKEGRGYTQLCPKFIYTRRANYPEGGMWLQNSLSIACKYGSCLESFIPCDDKNEEFMNSQSEPAGAEPNALNYRGKYYFEITGGITKIAEVMEQGYGVLLGFRFDYEEWVDVPFIASNKPVGELKVGHGVAAVDYCLWDGKRALVIEDSWGPYYGKGGRRIITEDFLNARCFYAGYITSLPNYVFEKTLHKGSKGIDVRKLQEKLNTQGYILTVDGKFGNLTQLAVMNFQRKHGLKDDGVVGRLTNQVLNSL